MNQQQRETLEHYIAQIEEVADRAERLQRTVDPAYKKILKDEVKGYRELITIWRKRLKGGA